MFPLHLHMRWNLLAGLFLIASVFATFSPVWDAQLVQWDDDINIYENPHLQKLNGESIRWMFTDCTYTPRYRPLNWLAWGLLYHFFGANGAPFHIALLVLHSVNSVLLFVLLLRLLKWFPMQPAVSTVNPRPVEANGSSLWPTICAFTGALLWTVHPLRVEVVGWANCQMYVQSLFFLLVSIHCYLQAIWRSPNPVKSGLFWVSVCGFLFSLLTYPTGIGLLAVLLAMDVLLFQRLPQDVRLWFNRDHRSVLVEKMPFLLVTLLVAGITLWARLNATEAWASFSRTENFGWDSRLAQASYIWIYFIWKPLWPSDLSPVYTQLISFRPSDPPFLISIAAVIGVSFLLYRNRRRWPGLLALWISHLVLLLPMLGLTDHPHFPNDRYGYVVGLLWGILAAAGLSKIKNAPVLRIAVVSSAWALAALFAILSHQQSRMWKNSVTLFETAIAKLGTNSYRSDLYWRLGVYHAKQGHEVEAMRNYAEAAKIFRGYPLVHNEMAHMLFKQNKFDEAIAHYQKVLEIFPNDALTHKNFGIVLARQGRLAEAVEHYAASLKSAPNDAAVHLLLAAPLHQLGRASEAFDHIFTAVRLDPKSSEAQFLAGNACMQLQRAEDALKHFRAAINLKPDYTDAHLNLGTALNSLGHASEALPHLVKAAQLNPAKPETHFAWARALSNTGQKEEALQKFQTALELAQTAGRNDLITRIQAEMQNLK